jgi:cobalt-zinc-cadmium efflux system membrane fusion protein
VDHEEDHGDEDLVPIKAPAAGTVLARSVTPGTVVSPSSEMFVITDLSRLWVAAAVNEEHLAKLREGLTARVYVQAYPDRAFTGTLTKIGEGLDPATRTIQARIEVPNEKGLLKPEMYATVDILAGGSEPALLVPQSAPQEVNGQTAVFVYKGGGRFEVRPIATGRVIEGLLEVVAGLKDGEKIVTRGAFVLKSQLLKSTMGE